MLHTRTVSKLFMGLFILTLLLLPGCGKSGDVAISELGSKTVTFIETKHMNNCGGKAESEQSFSNSFMSNIGGGVGIEGGYDNAGVIKGKIDSTYNQYHNSTSDIKLKAPQAQIWNLLYDGQKTNGQEMLRSTEKT